MSMQDPIADMLTRIRNGQTAGHQVITMPSSKLKIAILKVLQDEGYINNFSTSTDAGKNILSISLKYYEGRPVIEKIKRVSRAGLRVYSGSDDLPVVRSGMGIAIVSTPKGVMTGKAAVAQNLGGEVLCTVE
jgi:small subunit ribosomal protein S8